MTRERDACPFCGADDVELVSPWGGQLITSLMRCRACHTHFEAVRDAFSAPGPERTLGAASEAAGNRASPPQ